MELKWLATLSDLFDIKKIRKKPDPTIEHKTSFRQIMQYMIVPFRGMFIFTLILSVVQSLLFLLLPVLGGSIIDTLIQEGFSAAIVYAPFLFIAMFFMALIMFIRIYSNNFMGNMIIKNLRCDLFKSIQKASYNFLDYHATGDLVSRCTSDLNIIKNLMASQITMFIRQSLTIFLALILMAFINIQLSLIIYPIFPVLFFIIYKFKQKMGPAYKASREIYGKLTSTAEENITGVRVVRAFAMEEYEIEQFKRVNTEYLNKSKYLMKLRVLFEPTVRVIVNLTIVLIIFVGGRLTLQGNASLGIGDLFTYVLLLNFAVDPLFFINTFFGNTAMWLQITDRLVEILNNEIIIPEKLGKLEFTQAGKQIFEDLKNKKTSEQIESLDEDSKRLLLAVGSGMNDLDKIAAKFILDITEIKALYLRNKQYLHYTGAQELKAVNGVVSFSNVWLSYRNNDFHELQNIDFTTKPGENIAILGATGSGKTSLIRLIGRFYEIQKGAITIDGTDIRDVTKESLRKQIGFVPQESFLFSKTLRENLCLGRPDAPLEDVIAACKLANIHDYIDSLPDKYETIVGQRGVTLSGGQRQRVSIARALISKPKILILDDATSSVDVDTEFKIQEGFSKMFKNATTFIITQRLSTVRNADRIIVLDKGKIVQFDTHENLMKETDGIYYKLYTTLRVKERAEEI